MKSFSTLQTCAPGCFKPRQAAFNSGLAIALWLVAGLWNPQPVHAENFRLTSRGVEIPEAGYVTNTILSSARHELMFVPPHGWRQSFDTNALLLVWNSGDFATEIRMRIAPAWPPPQLKPEDLREKIRRDFPAARLKEEFACYTCGGHGLAFDLDESGRNDLTTRMRVAFVPFGGGTVEFTLITPAQDFARNQLLLGHLLNSFRASPRTGQ